MNRANLLLLGRARFTPDGWVRRGPIPHPHRFALRLAGIGVTALLVATVALAGDLNTVVLIAVIVTALAVVTAVNDLFLSLAFVACCALLWVVSGVSPTSWWCLPIAVELLVIHSAQTLAALGPAEAPVPRPVFLAWARRTLWVIAATALVATAGITISNGRPTGTAYAAASLVIALMVGVALLPRLFAHDDNRPS